MPFHSVLRAAPTQPDLATGDAKQEGWVTVFGFPEGYQDGVMRHLRDRGEVVEPRYGGLFRVESLYVNWLLKKQSIEQEVDRWNHKRE